MSYWSPCHLKTLFGFGSPPKPEKPFELFDHHLVALKALKTLGGKATSKALVAQIEKDTGERASIGRTYLSMEYCEIFDFVHVQTPGPYEPAVFYLTRQADLFLSRPQPMTFEA